MDKDLFYISLFLIVLGVGGQLVWIFFGGIPCVVGGNQPYLFGAQCDLHATAASFQELQNITGYMMIIGFIMLPMGLFKDGLPAPGTGAKIFMGFLLVIVVGLVFTTIILLPTTQSTTQKPETFITILPGSSNPGTVLTYSPQNVTVVIGKNNTIEWTNKDGALHTVTSKNVPSGAASFNSGPISTNQTFIYTFTVPGTYNYYCTFHPGWMHGTVNVVLS